MKFAEINESALPFATRYTPEEMCNFRAHLRAITEKMRSPCLFSFVSYGVSTNIFGYKAQHLAVHVASVARFVGVNCCGTILLKIAYLEDTLVF